MADNNLSIEGFDLAQAPAGVATGAVGRVDSVVGRVTITRTDGSQVTAESGQQVFKGDQVTTAIDGKLGIVFADNSSFSIGEKGSMTIDEMVYDPGSQTGKSVLNIATGVFSFVSGTLAKSGPDSMTLMTPVAVIGIRGTTGAGKAAPAGQTNTFALLPDAAGTVGEVSITTQSGTATMNVAYQALQVTSPFLPPPAPVVMPQSIMAKAFGGVTSSLPAASQPPSAPIGPAGGTTQSAIGAQQVVQQVAAATSRAFDQAMTQGGGNIDGAFAAATQVAAVAATIISNLTPVGAGAAGAPSFASVEAALNAVIGNAVAIGLAGSGAPVAGAESRAPVPFGPGGFPGVFGPAPSGPGFGGPGQGPNPVFRDPGFRGPDVGGPENGQFGIGVPGFGFGPFGPGQFDPSGRFVAGQFDLGFVPPESRSFQEINADPRNAQPERTVSVFQETLNATTGNDTLVGGDNNTQFTMRQGTTLGGNDSVNGGGGQDELNLTHIYNFEGAWDLTNRMITYKFTPSSGSLTSGTVTTISIEQLYADNGIETVKRIPIDPTSGFGYLRSGTENADTLTLANGTVIAGFTVGTSGVTRGTLTFGGGGNDTITGSVASDDIYGGADNDTITGGAGADQLYGGDGNDTFVFAASDFASAESANGGVGTDTLSISGANAFSSGTLAGIEALTFTASATATFAAAQVYTSSSLASALAVTGSGGTDAIIVNLSSAQTITLADWTFASWTSGTDTITLNGSTDADVITGSSQRDTISGGAGADTISGGANADTIDGGGGADTITTGTGSDTVRFQGTLATLGVDSISDFTKGSGGDILSFDLSDLGLANGTFTDSFAGTADIILMKTSGYADIAAAATALAASTTTATNAIFAFWDSDDSVTRIVHTTSADTNGTETELATIASASQANHDTLTTDNFASVA